jgi:hypothetical protein
MVDARRVVVSNFLSDRLLLNKIVKKKAVSKITAFFYWLHFYATQRLLSYPSIRIESLADNLCTSVPHIINHYRHMSVHNYADPEYANLFGTNIDGVKFVIQRHLGNLIIQGVY